MGVARNAALWAADNRWLRAHLPRRRWVRRGVARFMPGETVQDALGAAATLDGLGIPTMFTALGENVTSLNESRSIAEHYLHVLDRIAERGLETEISVKPTHLGMDLDPEATSPTSRSSPRRRRARQLALARHGVPSVRRRDSGHVPQAPRRA
jgi:proline dehydrogenase